MVADALLAAGPQRLLIEIKAGARDLSQILFDDALILRGRRDEPGLDDRAFGVETVAVIEDAARRFGAGMANASPRL
jgi:hypothetical protein